MYTIGMNSVHQLFQVHASKHFWIAAQTHISLVYIYGKSPGRPTVSECVAAAIDVVVVVVAYISSSMVSRSL